MGRGWLWSGSEHGGLATTVVDASMEQRPAWRMPAEQRSARRTSAARLQAVVPRLRPTCGRQRAGRSGSVDSGGGGTEGVGVGGVLMLSMKTVQSETNIWCTGKRLGPSMFIS
jgi:hypothetical protein